MADITIPEFVTPDFLESYDTDSIYETMRGILPEDIDSSEGSHTWNLLMPTALTLAELYEVALPEVIQLIFPAWSYGEYLDAHAQTRGMVRKAATAATGQVTITGEAGTVIPEGTMFSTPSMNEDDPSMTYVTTEEATIPTPPASTTPSTEPDDEEDEDDPPTGTVTVSVECTEPGSAGNTGAGTIIFLSSDVDGIEDVTNAQPVTGGIDEETDEALIQRIMEYDQTQGDSFVGNLADYRRWAMSVSGIGEASVIPAQDDTGIVTIVLTDTNGAPASSELCTAVYNYIMRPDAPYSRLAPVNAVLDVTAPSTVEIAVKATVELTGEAVLEDVAAAYLTSLQKYMAEAMADREIKITRVGALLTGIGGVNDFSGLQIGVVTGGTAAYGVSNIELTSTELPLISASDITLTAGTV